ncbi:MAG: hypothetical protein HY077_02630 [Elusimicrobia bacterium]|nr:hypothetical protein [Elusimicrobiota bacterium]
MRSRSALIIAPCLLAAACAGTTPSLGHQPERGLSSILIGSRIILPTGETYSGRMWLNFEGEGEGEGDKGNGETYRLALKPGQPMLYQVEPDSYHLAPTRNAFGLQQETLHIEIEGRTFRAPFPRDIQRKNKIIVKPTKIVSLGILEVRLPAALPGREAQVKVWLDDGVAARRKLIEDTVRLMMDPDAPNIYRKNAIDWSRALDQSLVDLTAESPPIPLYKRANP